MGATGRKATLRAVGTLVGGVLGAVCIGLVAALAGWAPGATPGKVAAMTFCVSGTGAAVQFARARDPSHDYAQVPATRASVAAAKR